MKNTIILILVVVLILSAVGYQVARYSNKETFNATVTEKERIITSSDGDVSSYYLVFTDKGTYTLKDELLYGNFRSSDMYGKLKINESYEFTTIGFRFGMTSTYPNIVDIK